MGGQFADARLFERGEVDNDGLAELGIANALEDGILLVARISLDVALRAELLLPLHFNDEVNMRRATGVRNGFNGAKQVIARRAGHETSEALKVHIALVLIDSAGVKVGAVVVTLPDFDEGAADRLAATVEDAPA